MGLLNLPSFSLMGQPTLNVLAIDKQVSSQHPVDILSLPAVYRLAIDLSAKGQPGTDLPVIDMVSVDTM